MWLYLKGAGMMLCMAGVLAVLGGCGKEIVEEVEEVPLDLDEARMKELARIGEDGFLVWERCREGVWEIWTKNLRGGKERRLVPAEEGRDHFCPQISPDGRKLAYMSFKQGITGYPEHREHTGALWIMDMKSKKRRKVTDKARTYAEDRAVTWLDANRIVFLDEEGRTIGMNLRMWAKRPLLEEPQERYGYLVSPDLKHATTGVPEFAVLDAEAKELHARQRLAGCQPFFTRDSVWGYWMGGAGGPMKRMRLSTRETGVIMEKNDDRLHEKRSYVYFPMISPCQRLLAFAASPQSHDHFSSDYDLYVAQLHPERLEIIGLPVRYTSFEACDRFPDVFREELALGSHFVEGETELEFEGSKGDDWYWRFNGGERKKGLRIRQVFSKPGAYWVEGSRGESRLRGYVHVSPAEAPEVEGVRREAGGGVFVDFNEPVTAMKDAVVRLKRTGESLPWELRHDNLVLLVTLPEDMAPDGDALEVSGFQDMASKPNAMAMADVKVPGAQWPAQQEDLVFVWEKNDGANTLPDGTPCEVEPKGAAFWNEHGAMKLRGGWFDAPGAGRRISQACRKSGEFSIEFVIKPGMRGDEEGFRPILSLSRSHSSKNFAIGQQGRQLSIRLRTPETSPDGRKQETHLAVMEDNRPHHLVAMYSKGKLVVFLDGNQIWNMDRLEGDFRNWEDMELRFGASVDGILPWRGEVERVSIYSKRLSSSDVRAHADATILALGRRTAPVAWKVRGRLLEVTPTPSFQEFQPYTEARVRHLYEVLEVLDGPPLPPGSVTVSHWSWMSGEPMHQEDLKPGDEKTLLLHRASDHPELEDLFTKDELGSGFDAEAFVDMTEWDEPQSRLNDPNT